MLARAVENWLDKASERSFQVPFCYMLAHEGYTVVHVSRHNAMEFGKDILAIDGDGTPCAFQLKGGNLSLNKWRNEVRDQVGDLVELAIEHPSIDASVPHRSFFVTNGKIEEEAAHAIDAYNKKLESRGHPELETWVGGQLVGKAKALQTDLWPSELVDAKTLLELYLHDGRDVFPKAKLASLLESTLPFRETAGGKAPSGAACNRAISSTAVLTALVLSSFTEQQNHVAEVEAWTIYVAYALALAEKWGLRTDHYEAEVAIALQAIKNKLADLAQEMTEREGIAEGLATADEPFREIRRHWLAALLCVLVLWRKVEREEPDEVERSVASFADESLKRLYLWGEAQIPQLLAVYWYQRLVNARSGEADRLLGLLTRQVCIAKKPERQEVLPDVYTEAKEWLPYVADQQLKELLGEGPLQGYRLAKQPLETGWKDYSHVLEGLLHLVVQQNWKVRAKELWPDVTRTNLHTFEFDEPWHFYRWRNQTGAERVVVPQRTQRWEDLKATASDSSGSGLPVLIRQRPVFALLFLCIYPHRTSATVLRWLNIGLKQAIRAA